MVIEYLDEIENFFGNIENREALNEYNIRRLYHNAMICSEQINYHVDFVRELTNILQMSGLNPLNYLNKIPTKYLYNDKDIKTFECPRQIIIIMPQAFDSCIYLNKIILNEGLRAIGSDAFQGCSSLTEIEIPSTVEDIGERAFANCSNLKTFKFNGTIEQWLRVKKRDNWATYSGIETVICVDGKDSSEVF